MRIAHHGAGAVIDLGLFAGRGLDHDAGFRRRRTAELVDEALDALITAGEALAIHQKLKLKKRSTILTSQLPVARWHEQIGDPTAADGILDRLVHNAHRIEMRGDSMRKKRGPQPSS